MPHLVFSGKSGSYEIPHIVKAIDSSAFKGKQQLTTITVPDSITEIAEEAFPECSGLKKVTISILSRPLTKLHLANAFIDVSCHSRICGLH